MLLRAPAKINLHLRVGKRRDDGFHPLLTWMSTIGLFDTLRLERDASAASQSEAVLPFKLPFELHGDCAALPNDAKNLIIRAASALADTLQRRAGEGRGGPWREGVSAFLTKTIPIGAGLGGGSSDAAATLLGLNELWQLHLPREQLALIGAGIGSDVPFFLHGPCNICTGRGEKIRTAAPPASRFALLILPRMSISTAEVYRRFHAMSLLDMSLGDDRAIENEPDFASWAKLTAKELLPQLRNDLEPAAFLLVPKLDAQREEAEQTLKRPVRMSGSGSSLFTLFDSRDEAESAQRILVDRFDARVVEIAVPI